MPDCAPIPELVAAPSATETSSADKTSLAAATSCGLPWLSFHTPKKGSAPHEHTPWGHIEGVTFTRACQPEHIDDL